MIVACVPAFNEEKTIARVILLAQRHVDWVVVCDDGSADMTAEIAERLGADVVRHEGNLGYGAAIQSLFRKMRVLGATIIIETLRVAIRFYVSRCMGNCGGERVWRG